MWRSPFTRETLGFADRREAGRALASRLTIFAHRRNGIVLGVPRGGVPVAYEIAQRLAWPLDVFLVRKLGTPGQEEFALGAIASGNIQVLRSDASYAAESPDFRKILAGIVQREKLELQRQESLYRKGRPGLELAGKTVILADDGVATGCTTMAAIEALRRQKVSCLILALPVAPPDTAEMLESAADEVVCLLKPPEFQAVGQFYADFGQTSDEEVQKMLSDAGPGEARAQAP